MHLSPCAMAYNEKLTPQATTANIPALSCFAKYPARDMAKNSLTASTGCGGVPRIWQKRLLLHSVRASSRNGFLLLIYV